MGIRFIQTAHSIKGCFGEDRTYTIWLVGRYSGKNVKGPKKPPKIPPIPEELKN